MSVQFLIGRPGTGKTADFIHRIVTACKKNPLGSPILWLVPRQATFQAERDLCCGTELGGFFRVRVLAFEELCRLVLAEVGGAVAPEVTPAGRRMILAHLLRRDQEQLTFFRSVATQRGLAAEIDAALDELERGGADLAKLAANAADPANTALPDKVRDLQLIYAAYDNFLGLQRLDPARRVQQAMEALSSSDLIRHADIHVDGFLHFTARERALLTALARLCKSMRIALTLDPASPVLKDPHHNPDELSLFHRMELEYKKLHAGFTQAAIKIDPPVLLREPRRSKSAGLLRIQRWTDGAPVGHDGVEMIQAPDKRAEVIAAARRVRDLVAAGWRYRDVTVLCRKLSDYHDLLDAAFSEHGIPYFADQRRSAAHHPLIQFLRAVLGLCAGSWPSEVMIDLIKSGLCGLTLQEADELENFVLLHGVRGQAWVSDQPWTGGARPADDADERIGLAASAQAADRLRRRIVDPLKPFVHAMKGEQAAGARSNSIEALLSAFAVHQTLAAWINQARAAGQAEQAAEHEQVWAQFLGLMGQIMDLFGRQPMTLEEFRSLLESALEGLDLAIAPPTVDQVLVGQVDRTRPPAVKGAIILGLSDGQFPQPPASPSILNDADRRGLAGMTRIELEPDTRRLALDELFLGYFAFTRPSELLIVTRPAADDAGRALAPGSLWRTLRSLFGDAPVVIAPGHDQLADGDVTTPRQLVSGLMQWTRGATPDGCWPALYQWFSRRAPSGDAVDFLRRSAWPALGYVNDARLCDSLAGQLFPAPLRVGVRQLEIFRSCPFQHFARYGLELATRDLHGITTQDTARLSRDILDRLLRDLLSANRTWCDLSPAELSERLSDLTADAGRRLKGELMLSSARNRHLLGRIEKTLRQVIAAQRAAGLRGEFRPIDSRVRFAQGGDLPPLRIGTPAGHDLFVSGEIDRVDGTPDGRAVVAVDYRVRAAAISPGQVLGGISLKLVTDLLVLEAASQKPRRPAGALNVQISRQIQDQLPDDSPAPTEEAFDLRIKPRGVIDAHFAPQMDTPLEGGASDVLAMYVTRQAQFGNRGKSDVADTDKFNDLIAQVRSQLGLIADEIRSGRIAVNPYKLGTQTPCPNCAYRDVCRFETADGYRKLPAIAREDVLVDRGDEP